MDSHPLQDALQTLLASSSCGSKQTTGSPLQQHLLTKSHDLGQQQAGLIRGACVLVEEREGGSNSLQQQSEQLLSEACSPCSSTVLRFVGVDKVPGHTRWPYRAVLSLPAWVTGEPVVCESYHSTAVAAARAVDAISIALLGRQAAVNFPASSYDAADLADAIRYLTCISGGAFESRSGQRQPGPGGPCQCSYAAKQASKAQEAVVGLSAMRCPRLSSSSSTSTSSPLSCTDAS